MTIIPRVSISVQLSNIKGLPTEKPQQMRCLCDDFTNWLLKTREGKLSRGEKQLRREDLQDYYQRKYPDTDIKVKNSILGSGLDLRFSYGNKSVEGFDIFSYALRYENNLQGYTGGRLIQALRHENFHLVDYLVNSKKLARKCEAIETFGAKVNKFYDIYFDGLYCNKLPGTTPELSLGERLENLKGHITKFFEEQKLAPNQRTLLLQDWRNSISGEHGAFSQEAAPIAVDFPEFIQVCDRDKKSVEESIYPQKSQLLDVMLRDELVSQRSKS